jgi:uncharacterized membrane-anchored protein
MHARRLPRISAPARLTQIAVIFAPGQEEAIRRHALTLLPGGILPDTVSAKHFRARLATCDFVWECHTEFATFTFIRSECSAEPFQHDGLSDVPADWIAALPATIIRATQLALLASSEPDPSAADLARYLHAEDMIVCDVLEGEARVWADFRLHDDGFGHFIVKDQHLAGGDATRLLQWLQELGNYRKMALLGLPLATALSSRLRRLERDLTELVDAIARSAGDREPHLFDALSLVAAELAKLESQASFRLAATEAYAGLVTDRLRGLREQRIKGHLTLSEFTERRLMPAIRTCSSLNKRLHDVSDRTGRASALIRTRIDASLQQQSRDLLGSMDQRASVQLRLQQTVEGLSIAAISYYVVGLLGYQFEALHMIAPALEPTVATAVATPFVVLLLWRALAAAQRRWHRSANDDAGSIHR